MKNLKNSKKTSGISLVALIVTIIVLIILTAAVIVTFMEGGIIEKAKEAVFKSDIRTYQEILAVKNAEKQIELATGNGEGGLYNETEYDKIKEIIPEFKEEYKDLIAIANGEIVLGTRTEDPYSKWLGELGIGAGKTSDIALLEEGDYVNYSIPETERKTYNITEKLGAEATNWIFNDGDESGDYQAGEEVIGYNEEIKWRVLKNDGSTVTLVSADPVENIYLCGEEGFTKGPGALDAICAEVYGGRNLRVEDVNEVLKYEPVPWYVNSDGEQVNRELGFTLGEAIAEDGYDVSEWSKPDNYEELDLYYNYSKTNCTEASDKAKDMIFRDKNYWLSSSCVTVYFSGGAAVFVVRFVGNDYIETCDLYFFDGSESINVWGLRPVVTLSSSVQVVDKEAGGDTQETAWELK
ncbi:MAG: hypothetical protein E7311_03600 [Clostridiales bacterium]|nr:hypothetical protein [Clostridiales bacterium]